MNRWIHAGDAAGAVFPISSADYAAEITAVGAGLRALNCILADSLWAMTETWPVDEPAPLSAGSVLAPWPNRVRAGRFRFGGLEHQLDLSEPERGNAIHGLVQHREWTPVEYTDRRVTLSVEVGYEQGWPFGLQIVMTYEVGSDGLTVTNSVTNIGRVPAPYGFGMHSFVRAGDIPTDECMLQLPASVRLPMDPYAKLPTGVSQAIAGTADDFRQPRPLKDVVLDTPFGGLVSDLDGRARTIVSPPSGPATVLWSEPRLRWLQVCTADPRLGQGFPGRGRALAVEPMTCPPDALNSGIDLLVLQPGDRFRVRWGMMCV